MSVRSRPLRVIQWATGAVGRHALAAITAHPDLERVGARVYSEGIRTFLDLPMITDRGAFDFGGA